MESVPLCCESADKTTARGVGLSATHGWFPQSMRPQSTWLSFHCHFRVVVVWHGYRAGPEAADDEGVVSGEEASHSQPIQHGSERWLLKRALLRLPQTSAMPCSLPSSYDAELISVDQML